MASSMKSLFWFCLRSGLPRAPSNVFNRGLFRHFRYIFVYSVHDPEPWASTATKKRVDHNFHSVTVLMITDGHIQNGSNLCKVSSTVVKYCPFCRNRETSIGAEFGQLKVFWTTCEMLLIFAQQVSLCYIIGQKSLICCRQFWWHVQGLQTTRSYGFHRATLRASGNVAN